MTIDEFHASGWSLNTINKVIIYLKDNEPPIFPAKLIYPILRESSPENVGQQGEDEQSHTHEIAILVTLNFEVLTQNESSTESQPAQWIQGSVPLESVVYINRLI